MFAALAHLRRRYLLYALVENRTDATLSELAGKIVSWERDEPVSQVTDVTHGNAHVRLRHAHVPKLADVGVVEYRPEEDVVVRARNTEQVRPVPDGAGAELDRRRETHARGTHDEELERR